MIKQKSKIEYVLRDTVLTVLITIITASQLFKGGLDSIISLLIGFGLAVAFMVALENWFKEYPAKPKPNKTAEPRTTRQPAKPMVLLIGFVFITGLFITLFFGYLILYNAFMV